jgi:hypothetical protein
VPLKTTRWVPARSQARRRKYGNNRDSGFDSNKEAARFRELELAVKAGVVRGLQLQVRFELIPAQDGERPVYYVADFVYEELQANGPGGHWVREVEDCKSEITRKNREYIIKRKLMRHVHGIRIRET